MANISINERFAAFDAANPKIYEMFCKYSMSAINAGRRRFGAQMIIERIRWYSAVETTGEIYKISNDFAAFYARKFEKENPQYQDFFTKRESCADDVVEVVEEKLQGGDVAVIIFAKNKVCIAKLFAVTDYRDRENEFCFAGSIGWMPTSMARKATPEEVKLLGAKEYIYVTV